MSKFKVGDKAFWKEFGEKVEIWGKRYDEKANKYEYATFSEDNARVFLFENELKSIQIEKGDIVKFPNGNKGLVEYIAKKKLFDGEELALIDMIDTNATNTDYKLISTCVIELVEKGGN